MLEVSCKVIGDIGWGSSTEGIGLPPDIVTVSVALIIVEALSIRQWNDSLWLLVVSMFVSMFRRMEGVKGDIQREHGWTLVMYRFDRWRF